MARTPPSPGAPTMDAVTTSSMTRPTASAAWPIAGSRQSRPVHRPGRLLAVAAASAAGVALTYLLLVRTATGQWIDTLLFFRGEHDDRGAAHAVLDVAGSPGVLVALVVAVLAAGALTGRWWRGVAGIAVALGAVLVARLLKAGLDRPDLDVTGSTTHNSFASGHVAAAAGLALAVLLVTPASARALIAVPGFVAVAAVGWATVVAGWHRPSDVLGAVFVAAALAALAAAMIPAS